MYLCGTQLSAVYLGVSSLLSGTVDTTPEPLGIMAASQSPVAIYSLRKVNPGYAGNCLQVRDSGNILRTCGFDGNGNVDVSLLSTYGDGVNFTVATWYDQSGNGNNFTSTSRPILKFAQITNAASQVLPGIDFTSKTLNMTTASTFFNAGGTNNLAVHVIAQTQGWSSAGTHARSPAVYSNADGALLGYGTLATGELVTGAHKADGETVMYKKTGELLTEDGTPTEARLRNIWFNQQGANVSGGSDVRKLFTGRPHDIANASAQRLVLGNNGAVTQSHNGAIFEVILYQNAAPMTDAEAWAISLGQRQYWGALAAANFPTRYYAVGSGQSLMQYMDTVASASTSVIGDSAAQRVFRPTVSTLIDIAGRPDRKLKASFANTAVGGSSILKTDGPSTPDGGGGASWLVWNGVDATKKFWWDQYNDIPGPVMQTVLQQLPPYVGAAYAKTAILWDQGQAEATYMTSNGESGAVTVAAWVTTVKKVWATLRTALGSASIPIYIQPLGRQTGCDTYMRLLRLAQNQLASEVAGVFIGPGTHDLTRQDTVHLGAGPADPNGFDASATRLARGFVGLFDPTIKYSGPYVAGASKSGANIIDVSIAWTTTGSGTDITPASGIVGFEVADGSGARTISGAIRQSATVVRLTVSGAALSGTVSVIHNPQVSALDRTLMLRDNTGLPLDPSPSVIAS